ncbi:MAG: hypothetical protein ACI81T_003880 [Bacteroidia bacterium]|jgi:hypothetical protein
MYFDCKQLSTLAQFPKIVSGMIREISLSAFMEVGFASSIGAVTKSNKKIFSSKTELREGL